MIERDPYVTIEQAAELCAVDARTIHRWIEDGKLAGKRAPEASSNGKVATLGHLLSLPLEAQVRYWQNALAPATPDKPAINLAEVPKASLDEALRRHPFVLRALEIIEARAAVSVNMDALATEAGETSRTLYRWVDQWKRDGMPGLLPKWGKKRGTFTALSMAIQEVIKYEYLSPSRPSVTTVYKRVKTYCEEPGVMLPVPCVNTVNKFIKSLPLPARVLAREGPEAWRKECEPKCHRNWDDYKVGEMYVGDHRLMDVFVRWGNLVRRLWLTAWYDPKSRTCVGWHVALEPDSNTIALSLRAAMLRFGVPRELYVDNGKDYKSHYLNGKTLTHKDVRLSNETIGALRPGFLNPLGVQIRHAQKYTPWAKPIEPWFGHTFPVWERTLPGYCGSDNKQKPEKLTEEIRSGALLTAEAFIASLAARIEEYNETEHSELDGKPIDQWLNVPIERPDPRTCDIMLLRHKPVKVYPQGIKLFGSAGEPRYYWHDALALHVGHVVDVRYDDNDIGRLYVFVNGKHLCEAVNQSALSMKASKQDLKDLHKKKAHARKAALNYPETHRTLMNPEEALRQIANERRTNQVVAIGQNPDPRPQPGTIAKPPRLASMMARGPVAGAASRSPLAAPKRRSQSRAIEAAPGSGPDQAPAVDERQLERERIHQEIMNS